VTPEEVLAEIERLGKANGWPIIGSKRGKFLDEVVRPKTTLEVGTFYIAKNYLTRLTERSYNCPRHEIGAHTINHPSR